MITCLSLCYQVLGTRCLLCCQTVLNQLVLILTNLGFFHCHSGHQFQIFAFTNSSADNIYISLTIFDFGE